MAILYFFDRKRWCLTFFSGVRHPFFAGLWLLKSGLESILVKKESKVVKKESKLAKTESKVVKKESKLAKTESKTQKMASNVGAAIYYSRYI